MLKLRHLTALGNTHRLQANPISALERMTAMPDKVPVPLMIMRAAKAAITTMTVGIGPKVNAVTLIRIDRVSNIIPDCNVKGTDIMIMQIIAMKQPLMYGCNLRKRVEAR